MPEYLAPGVFVEETSFRAKSIEGVSTTTTGFVGPTRFGPLDIEPDIVTSLVEFERVYGGKERLKFTSEGAAAVEMDNFMWHAVRAFFEEGGKRLYVSRVYSPSGGQGGCSEGLIGTKGSGDHGIAVRARFPGRAGDARVSFTFNVGQNVLVDESPPPPSAPPSPAPHPQPVPGVRALQHRDVVLITRGSGSPPQHVFALALYDSKEGTWHFSEESRDGVSSPRPLSLASLLPGSDEVRIVTVSVAVEPLAAGALPCIESGLPLDPDHRRGDTPDSLFDAFAPHQRGGKVDPPAKVLTNLARARTLPIVIERGTGLASGIDVLEAFFQASDTAAAGQPDPESPSLRQALAGLSGDDRQRRYELPITGGSDGMRPAAEAYRGGVNSDDLKTGLYQFEDLEDISIVAAPGATLGYEDEQGHGAQARAVIGHLISHAERMHYRIAVLDSGDNQSISQVRAMRAKYDSSHAALYYPWVRVLDPLTRREVHLPPSGFVCGIYARNDTHRAVYKAPANEVVNLALGFERFLNKSQQEVLNPEGINCFRFFEGRGMRLWGARTISSDPEWKYVNLRRYFAYLERSIDKGTQWAVFEPNGEQLWGNVRRTIEDFLLNEWQSGALLGERPDKAYFVKCDRSTMSQNDLDNGRLICLVGVAPLRPAEFVIFRIGQWTSDRRA